MKLTNYNKKKIKRKHIFEMQSNKVLGNSKIRKIVSSKLFPLNRSKYK
jgi:hypothetical protein